jgi:hypothetical protein
MPSALRRLAALTPADVVAILTQKRSLGQHWTWATYLVIPSAFHARAYRFAF